MKLRIFFPLLIPNNNPIRPNNAYIKKGKILPIHPGKLDIGMETKADITRPAIKPRMPAARVKPDMLLLEFML